MWYLVVLALLTRLPYIVEGTIPFTFDHGRDSLAVLHLIKTGALKFIGPWTSIPGLFVGPGWFYFQAIPLWLGQANPIVAVLWMLMFYLIIVILAAKYLGFYEAAILSTAPIWTQLATGSHSPNVMPLLVLLIVILLKKLVQEKTASLKTMALLGLMLGLGFHFSYPSAIFNIVLIPLILIWRRVKLKLKHWLAAGLTILLTFLPQILFELKHNFLQVRSVINYFSQGESQAISRGKILGVTKSIFRESSLAVLPDILILKIIALALLAIGLVYLIRKKQFTFWPEILILTLVPIVGFWFLHYNVWYVYSLFPVAVIAAGKILRSLPKTLAIIYLLLLLLNCLINLYSFEIKGKDKVMPHKFFLPVKLKALDYIYQQSEGKPFSSYQYEPDIYDYAYQYLYLWQGFQGRPLPVEFSYQPGEISYVTEKPDLLSKLEPSSGPAEKIFLIIELPENEYHYPLDAWLKRIDYTEVISRQQFGPELEVWQVRPRGT